MRYTRKTDANQKEISAALRAMGCKIIDLSQVGKGCPDLLILTPAGELRLLEIKNPNGRGRRFTPDQKSFYAAGWPVAVVTDPTQATAIAMGEG